MPEKKLTSLDIGACKEIVISYQNALQSNYKDMSTLKNLMTGTFYRGKHSRYFLMDFLAGGVTNNYGLNLSPHLYGNFIYFVDAICKDKSLEEKDRESILQALSTVDSLDALSQTIEKYQTIIPEKCYYDLQADLKENINHYNEENRKAETESHRRSKISCFFYALCQGFIEVRGMTAFPFIAALILPWSWPVMAAVFTMAFFINYSFAREDTYGLIKKWKTGSGITGNLFARNIGTNDKPQYEPYTRIETGIAVLFLICSFAAGFCIFALAAGSMPVTFPLWLAHLAASPIFFPASLVFSKTIFKFIDKKEWKKIKKYLWDDFFEAKTKWDFCKLFFGKLFKLTFSIAASAVVLVANCFIYSSKLALLLAVAVTAVSVLIFTGITAGVKSIFCMSRVAELLESFGEYISNKLAKLVDFLSVCFNRDEKSISVSKESSNGNTPKFNPLQESDRRCSTVAYMLKALALTVHCASEGGTVLNATTDMSTTRQIILSTGKSVYSFFTSLKPIFFASEDHRDSSVKNAKNSNSPKK